MACSLLALACGGRQAGPPVATPTVTLPAQATAGQSAPVGFRFAVAADAPPFTEDYVVFVHVFDEDGHRLWTSDHEPPTPTTQWKAGTVVEYTRNMLVPRHVLGTVSLTIGLYSPRSQQRLALTGDDTGGQAYRVGSIAVGAASSEKAAVFAQGFHQLEAPEDSQGLEWQWSGASGQIWLPNPKQDTQFVIELDQPEKTFTTPQQVTLSANGATLGSFAVKAGERAVYRVPLPATSAGTANMVRVTMTIDNTFVPARLIPGAGDSRELGVRVFTAYLEPAR